MYFSGAFGYFKLPAALVKPLRHRCHRNLLARAEARGDAVRGPWRAWAGAEGRGCAELSMTCLMTGSYSALGSNPPRTPRTMLVMAIAVTLVSRKLFVSFSSWCHLGPNARSSLDVLTPLPL